ncbi:hypothetical protein E2C01_066872 [Portunus trituberculatus]|uniref:Uncharacterized protein n=1 Tax=Portunus trituberculatus TaxID=210409 RepID=A0A5B7HJC6_PORTR|nr:hypothetical protein [Portunus trituberculatus]
MLLLLLLPDATKGRNDEFLLLALHPRRRQYWPPFPAAQPCCSAAPEITARIRISSSNKKQTNPEPAAGPGRGGKSPRRREDKGEFSEGAARTRHATDTLVSSSASFLMCCATRRLPLPPRAWSRAGRRGIGSTQCVARGEAAPQGGEEANLGIRRQQARNVLRVL